MLPADWRSPDPSQKLVLLPWPLGAEQFILVLPPARWLAMFERLNTLSLSSKEVAAVERVLGSTSAHLGLDGNGRLCLPEAMARQAGITGEVLFLGRLNKFEIWHPERYAPVQSSDQRLAVTAINSMNL